MTLKKWILAVVSAATLLTASALVAQNYTAPDSNDLVRITREDANGVGTPGAVPVTALFNALGIGYSTGGGGAVTQITSRTTGVTLNEPSGGITLVSAAGSTTPASFTVTDSFVAATDTVVLVQKSGTDLYSLSVTAMGAGTFQVTSNTKSGTTTEQPVFNFAVIKGAAS